MKIIKGFIKSLRPTQWVKNLLVFAGLLFSRKFFEFESIYISVLAFFIFCFASGFVYIINDIKDREVDRTHPEKRYRPIASGIISPAMALSLSVPIILGVLAASYFLINLWFLIIISGYVLLNILYSFYLKHIVILDIMLVAAGFLLRAVGGVIAIDTELTHWFVITIFFLALLVAAGKRRQEVLLIEESVKKRQVIEHYSTSLLNQIIAVSSATSLVTYSLYTIHIYEEGDIPYLFFTIPFVVFGIFRYLYIIFKKGEGGSPEKIFLKDIPIIIDGVLYAVIIFILLILNSKN